MLAIEAFDRTSSLLSNEEIKVRSWVNVEGEEERWEELTTHMEYSRIEAEGVPSKPQMAENFFFDSGTAAAQQARNSSFVTMGKSGATVVK